MFLVKVSEINVIANAFLRSIVISGSDHTLSKQSLSMLLIPSLNAALPQTDSLALWPYIIKIWLSSSGR